MIPADATSVEDLENVFKRSMEVLGGPVDFVLHSIGMSPNVRKKRTYDDLDYDMLEKTLDISAVSFHKMIQAAKKLNAIADYGSILALSYVAAQRTFYGYNDMADARHCWNPLPAASVTSTDVNTMYVSTPFPSLPR